MSGKAFVKVVVRETLPHRFDVRDEILFPTTPVLNLTLAIYVSFVSKSTHFFIVTVADATI